MSVVAVLVEAPPPCSVVEYASYGDMKNAVRKLDGAELNGRRIKLYEDKGSRRRKSSRLFKPSFAL